MHSLYFLALSKSSSLGQVVFLLVLFALIILGAYYATYIIAKVQQGVKRNSNLQIIEAMSIGQQKSIQLIRIGNKYAVISLTKNNIQLLMALDEEDIVIPSNTEKQNYVPFKQILNKYRSDMKKKDDKEGDTGEDHHET